MQVLAWIMNQDQMVNKSISKEKSHEVEPQSPPCPRHPRHRLSAGVQSGPGATCFSRKKPPKVFQSPREREAMWLWRRAQRFSCSDLIEAPEKLQVPLKTRKATHLLGREGAPGQGPPLCVGLPLLSQQPS